MRLEIEAVKNEKAFLGDNIIRIGRTLGSSCQKRDSLWIEVNGGET